MLCYMYSACLVKELKGVRIEVWTAGVHWIHLAQNEDGCELMIFLDSYI